MHKLSALYMRGFFFKNPTNQAAWAHFLLQNIAKWYCCIEKIFKVLSAQNIHNYYEDTTETIRGWYKPLLLWNNPATSWYAHLFLSHNQYDMTPLTKFTQLMTTKHQGLCYLFDNYSSWMIINIIFNMHGKICGFIKYW